MVKNYSTKTWYIFGTGFIARHYLSALTNIFDNPRIILCSRFPADALVKFSDILTSSIDIISYENLFHFDSTSVPLICTPYASHASLIDFCIDRSSPLIFCEKPISYDTNILSKYIGQKIALYGLYNRRFYNTVSNFKSLIKRSCFIHGSISISLDDATFFAFLPHFIDLVFYLTPPLNNRYQLVQLSKSVISLNFSTLSSSCNTEIPVDIKFFLDCNLLSRLELFNADGSGTLLEPIESLFSFNVDSVSSPLPQKNQTIKTYFSKINEFNVNNSKPGFESMLYSINRSDYSNFHDLDSSFKVSDFIYKLRNVIAST